jgi:hypothetical protein
MRLPFVRSLVSFFGNFSHGLKPVLRPSDFTLAGGILIFVAGFFKFLIYWEIRGQRCGDRR